MGQAARAVSTAAAAPGWHPGGKGLGGPPDVGFHPAPPVPGEARQPGSSVRADATLKGTLQGHRGHSAGARGEAEDGNQRLPDEQALLRLLLGKPLPHNGKPDLGTRSHCKTPTFLARARARNFSNELIIQTLRN